MASEDAQTHLALLLVFLTCSHVSGAILSCKQAAQAQDLAATDLPTPCPTMLWVANITAVQRQIRGLT